MKKSEWIEENDRFQELDERSILSHSEDNEEPYDIGVLSHYSENYNPMEDYESTIHHFQD